MRTAAIGTVLAALAGCAWFEGDPEPEEGTGTKVGYAPFEADGGERTPEGAIDPVTGEWVRGEARFTASYEGLTYFFASEESRETFRQRPYAFVTEDGYLRKPLDEIRREAEAK